MPLIRNGETQDDVWTPVADEDTPPSGPIIVSLTRWTAERQALTRRNSPLGIRLKGGDDPALLERDLQRIDLIALEFASFTDGRSYSSARLLRRLGFTGEIRAVGQVLRDQIPFMLRCGFDSLAVTSEHDAEGWADTVGAFAVPYQAASDLRRPAWVLRHAPRS